MLGVICPLNDQAHPASTNQQPLDTWSTTVSQAAAKAPARNKTTAKRSKPAPEPKKGEQPVLPTEHASAPGHASEPVPAPNPEPKTVMPAPTTTVLAAAPPPQRDEDVAGREDYTGAVRQFCSNISAGLNEARAAWLKNSLGELERQLEQRIGILEAKTAEHKQWLQRRQELSDRVGQGLVQVFTRMRAEAAAQQLAALDEETAVALLMRLEPKVAGNMMSEMPVAKAARVAGLMAQVAEMGTRRANNQKSGAKSPPAGEAPR